MVLNIVAFLRMTTELLFIGLTKLLLYVTLQHSVTGKILLALRHRTNEQTAISRPSLVWLSVWLSFALLIM